MEYAVTYTMGATLLVVADNPDDAMLQVEQKTDDELLALSIKSFEITGVKLAD